MQAIKPEIIKRTRAELGMTQAQFAGALHLSVRTVEDWELRGVAMGPAAVLIWLVSKMPKQAIKALKDF
jgi:DNA-binding transcriptional regulator YiaG